jgi:hypothetical protein
LLQLIAQKFEAMTECARIDPQGMNYSEFNAEFSPTWADRPSESTGSVTDAVASAFVLRPDYPIAVSSVPVLAPNQDPSWESRGIYPDVSINLDNYFAILGQFSWSAVPDIDQTYSIDLMALPGAQSWGFTGEFYIPGADVSTGGIDWYTNPDAATARVMVVDDRLTFTSTEAVSRDADTWDGPELFIWAMTDAGYQVEIAIDTKFKRPAFTNPLSAPHVFEVAEGSSIEITADVLRNGASWDGGDVALLKPSFTGGLPSNVTQTGSGLTAFATSAGEEQQFPYSLGYTQPQSAGTFASPPEMITVRTVGGAPPVAPPVEEEIAPPTIVSLSPSEGPTAGGTEVTVTGTGFDQCHQISIDGMSQTTQHVDGRTLAFVTPSHVSGSVEVTVAGCDRPDTGPATYTYIAPAPEAEPEATPGFSVNAGVSEESPDEVPTPVSTPAPASTPSPFTVGFLIGFFGVTVPGGFFLYRRSRRALA